MPETRAQSSTRRGGHGNGTRQAPYHPQAEHALLGAAMLTRTAAAAVAQLDIAAFSPGRNQDIAQAIARLHAAGTPIDPVTVHGELPASAGVGFGDLVEMQTGTPATSNAPHYANVINQCWTERRQIAIAQELVEDGYLGLDSSDHIRQLVELRAAATADELELDDLAAALDDDYTEQATILARADGQHLLYPAAVNVLMGEPTGAKTWVALIAAVEVIDQGGHVLYLDYEDTPRRVARRMLTLGADRDAILDQFHYKRLRPLTPAGIAALPQLARTLNARLIVIDGLAAALGCQQYEENSATDVASWWNAVPLPLADTGASVLILDHVAKDRETRGRWARGSGHKLAALDGVAYGLTTIEPFSRHRSGKVKVTIAKDRPGVIGATGEHVAVIDFSPHNDGAHLEHTIGLPPSATWEGPTNCMDTVLRLFTEHPDLELATRQLAPRLKDLYGSAFRATTVRAATEQLVVNGDLAVRRSGNASFYRLNNQPQIDTEEMF